MCSVMHMVCCFFSPERCQCAWQAVMSRYGAEVNPSTVMAAVEEVAGLVSDADLLTTPMALQFCLTLLPKQPKMAPDISSKFLPAALQLVKSPLLQVSCLAGRQHTLALRWAAGPLGICNFGRSTCSEGLFVALLSAGRCAG